LASTEPRKLPHQKRARDTVTVILDATAHILAKEGFEAVNTNRVAERAGVSVGSLYQYFPNKGALVGAVAVRHSEAMAAIVGGAVSGARHRDLRGLVGVLIRATMDAHAENAALRHAILEELPRIGRPKRIAEIKRAIQLSVVALLTIHKRSIRVRDLTLAAFVIVNTVEHLTHAAHSAGHSARELEKLERELRVWITAYLTGGRP
jgi:AcrR family transcriptional regulator